MESLSTEGRRELIRHVFPALRYGGDPDIERYFECRRNGRLGEALSVYNGPLRRRYPDDASRILLLKLYRERDPRWEEVQDRLILELAGRIAEGLARNIDVLAAPLEGVGPGDAFRALGAVESLLAIIPAKGDDALLFLDRYATLADLLGHRYADIDKARRLVGEYLAMMRANAAGETDFIARSAALEERRRAAAASAAAGRREGAPTERYDFIARSEALEERRRKEAEGKTRFFDLSRIKFQKSDLERILIPSGIERREDQVLAYCWRYWDLVRDPGFERLVFLYSQKYGSLHYPILRAIKLGRGRGATDDEILTAVSTLLSTSYSYSVSGDLYMQVNWRRLRANAEAREAAALEAKAVAETERLARQARTPGARTSSEERLAVLRSAPRAAAETAPPTPVSPGASTATTGRAAPDRGAPLRPSVPVAAKPPKPAPARPAVSTPRAGSPKPVTPGSSPSTPKASTGADRSTPTPTSGRLAPRKAPGPAVEELHTQGGSVSDKIRKLSGKAYDVYRQLFLEGVRTDIHRTLVATKPKGGFRLFDDSANEAEDHIYAFLARHYADPYMDWPASEERRKVEALGFSLPSLDPIIEAWYARVA